MLDFVISFIGFQVLLILLYILNFFCFNFLDVSKVKPGFRCQPSWVLSVSEK